MTYERHGLSRTPVYRAWCNMKQRCLNPRFHDFNRYGGRGISICRRWMSFAAFYADMGDRPDGLTLDRIDNEGDYEPGNCRWATWTEQAANRPYPKSGLKRTLAIRVTLTLREELKRAASRRALTLTQFVTDILTLQVAA